MSSEEKGHFLAKTKAKGKKVGREKEYFLPLQRDFEKKRRGDEYERTKGKSAKSAWKNHGKKPKKIRARNTKSGRKKQQHEEKGEIVGCFGENNNTGKNQIAAPGSAVEKTIRSRQCASSFRSYSV